MTVSDILMKQMQMLSEQTEKIIEEPNGAADKAKAVVILSKAMVRLSLELRLVNKPEPFFSPVENLQKDEAGLSFRFADRQPNGIAAQLTAGEREKITPDALQRMADVLAGTDSER